MERKIQQLKKEKETAEKQAKDGECQASSGKVDKLATESKLLEVELAHSSCKTHTANLLVSLDQAEHKMKIKEEAWSVKKEQLEEDITDIFATEVDQLKAFLCERYPSVGVD